MFKKFNLLWLPVSPGSRLFYCLRKKPFQAYSRNLVILLMAAVLLVLSACSESAPEAPMQTVLLPSPYVDIYTQSPVEGTFQVISLEKTPSAPEAALEQSAVTETKIAAPLEGTVLVHSNCRSGPGTEYELIGGYTAGEKVELIGISPDKKWWVVRMDQSGGRCWILGDLMESAPRARDLPVFPVPSLPAVPVTGAGDLNYELALLDLINEERVKVGVGTLTMDPYLVASARSHSSDMAMNDFFDHTGTGKTSFAQRISDQGYPFSLAGETLCAGGDAHTCISLWLESPAHRETMLNPAFTHVGIGITWSSESSHKVYITADYGSP